MSKIVTLNCPESNRARKLLVKGTAFFGSDLGSDSRPEPVGSFIMTEENQDGFSEGGDDEDDDLSEEKENMIFRPDEGFE